MDVNKIKNRNSLKALAERFPRCTVEPRFNEPLFNEVLDITNDILCPGITNIYNKFFDITRLIRKPKRKIYLDITNYNANTRQKIYAEQINSQQIL